MPTIIWYTLIGLFIFVMIFVITRSEVCLRLTNYVLINFTLNLLTLKFYNWNVFETE